MPAGPHRLNDNPYATSDNPHGPFRLDTFAFTRDLAPLLDGTVDIKDANNQDRGAAILLPDDMRLTIWTDRSNPEKVDLRIYPSDLPIWPNPFPAYSDTYKLPSIGVSTGRPLAKIAADIKRRLIPEAKAPCEARRKYVRQQNEATNSLTAYAARVKAEIPGFRITEPRDDGSPVSLSAYWGTGATYLDARLYSNGNVGIDRISSMPFEMFKEVCRVLGVKPKTA